MKIIISFIFTFNSLFAFSSNQKSLTTEQFNQKKQLVLQILNNKDGLKLKTALKEILPLSDHSFIDTHISDQIKINYKIKDDTIVIDSKTKITINTDDTMMLNGVRVKYDRSQSLENNIKNLTEKARQFGLIQFFLPEKAHAVLPGLIAGIAIDMLVPAVILALTSTLAISYGALGFKFFNYSLIDNAEIICASNGKLYYNSIDNDLGVELLEVKIIKQSIKEYEKLLPADYKCTEGSAKEAQSKIRLIASAAAKKIKNDQVLDESKIKPVKGISAPANRSGTSH